MNIQEFNNINNKKIKSKSEIDLIDFNLYNELKKEINLEVKNIDIEDLSENEEESSYNVVNDFLDEINDMENSSDDLISLFNGIDENNKLLPFKKTKTVLKENNNVDNYFQTFEIKNIIENRLINNIPELFINYILNYKINNKNISYSIKKLIFSFKKPSDKFYKNLFFNKMSLNSFSDLQKKCHNNLYFTKNNPKINFKLFLCNFENYKKNPNYLDLILRKNNLALMEIILNDILKDINNYDLKYIKFLIDNHIEELDEFINFYYSFLLNKSLYQQNAIFSDNLNKFISFIILYLKTLNLDNILKSNNKNKYLTLIDTLLSFSCNYIYDKDILFDLFSIYKNNEFLKDRLNLFLLDEDNDFENNTQLFFVLFNLNIFNYDEIKIFHKSNKYLISVDNFNKLKHLNNFKLKKDKSLNNFVDDSNSLTLNNF